MAYGNVGGSAGGGRERSKGTSKGGMRSGPPGGMRSKGRSKADIQSGGKSSGLAGGDRRGPSGTVISFTRWNKMSDYAKRNEFGTTSYDKYKENAMGKTGRRKGMRSGR